MGNRVCVNCGCVIEIPCDEYEVNERVYCKDCYFEKFVVCDNCGEVVARANAAEVLSWEDAAKVIGYACWDCVDEGSNDWPDDRFARCTIMGKVFRKEDMRRVWFRGSDYLGNAVHDKVWVSDFAYQDLHYCGSCCNFVPDEDWDIDYNCCFDCADAQREAEDDIITGYHDHHGDWECYGEEEDLFGIELEVEGPDERRNRHAEWLNTHFNDMADTHVSFENDGSLSDYGFEIISHPHDWDSFNALDWEAALNYLSGNGFKSHDTTTCGLHIHINRHMFGEDSDEQYESLAKVCYFYSVAWVFFLKLSRRTQAQADSWARRYVQDDYSEARVKVRDDDETKNCSRYSAVNLSNYETIEFRLGRGTLRYKSFRAWIDLHLTIVRNAKNIDDFNLRNLSMWLDGIEENTLEYIRYREAFDLVGGEPVIETREMKER